MKKDFPKIIEMITNDFEREYLDFKAKHYPSKGGPDLLKDILSMANSSYSGDKYILLGIKDNLLEGRQIWGISKEDIVDAAVYQQFILNNIEPDLNIDIFYMEHHAKLIGVIRISNTTDKPYMIKKKFGNLHEGLCYIRKGSQNSIAKRADFDRFYHDKENFDIKILNPTLRGVNDKDGLAYLEVVMTNSTKFPLTILGGRVTIYLEGKHICDLPIFGFGSYVGADFKQSFGPYTELVEDLFLGMTSTDCVKLGLDEAGVTESLFSIEIVLYDTKGEEYKTVTDKCFVYAKGDFLWKIKHFSM